MPNVLDTVPITKSFGAETDELNSKLFAVITTTAKYLGQPLEITVKVEVPETVTAGALGTALDAATADAWEAAGYSYPA